MLDFSWGHILIVLMVALVVVGPKDLPRLMRIAGQWAGKARAMVNELRGAFDEMAREAELDELRAEIAALKSEQEAVDQDINKEFDVSMLEGTTPAASTGRMPVPQSLVPEPAPQETAPSEPLPRGAGNHEPPSSALPAADP